LYKEKFRNFYYRPNITIIGHEIKKGVMGEACRTYRCKVKYFINFSKQNTRTNHVRDVGIDGGLLLPLIFRSMG